MAMGEDVYCTLLMGDAYLPGAAVLAHSLRDTGTTRKLACLIVQDTLQPSTIEELQSLYNYVIPVERIGNPNPANLYLMNRPDLLFTFTKIHLWRLVQFRKIVYLDSDTVALRAPEELFDLPDAFAAAPDVGWPDAFNTGVMVLTPSMGEYHALRGLAQAGDSFDGADQGLLNQYYQNRPWKRLSFTYNTTPSAHYQYEPAYRYYKQGISVVHFIGSNKPWQRGRSETGMPGAFQELLSRWWAVYDRHFHVSTDEYINTGRRNTNHTVQDQVYQEKSTENYGASGYPADSTSPSKSSTHVHFAPSPQRKQFTAPRTQWDATRGAPPLESRPEAVNFPNQTYEFNHDPAPFRPPPSYPEPPKDMWYTIPEKPQPETKLKPMFPWEERQDAKPSRRFIDDEPPPTSRAEPSYLEELEVTTDKLEPATPTIRLNNTAMWQPMAPSRNAWDDDSSIEKYVRQLTNFQRNRGKVQVVQTDVPSREQPTAIPQDILSPTNQPDPAQLIDAVRQRRESLILTDFPSPSERPSLPVTPAPRRRPTFWGEDKDVDQPVLPVAAGVPDQADWNPSAQLEQLRRNSLLGPPDLTLPADRRLSNREMVGTSAPILEQPEPKAPASTDPAPTAESHFLTSPPASTTPSTTESTKQSAHSVPDTVVMLPESIVLPSGQATSEQTEINTALNAAITAPSGPLADVDPASRVIFAEPGFGAPPPRKAGSLSNVAAVDEVEQKEVKEAEALSPTASAST